MFKLIAGLLVLASSCFAHAGGVGGGGQTGGLTSRSSTPAVDPNAPKAQISGQVLDSGNGQPLKKAWIAARSLDRNGRGGSTVATDAEGHFLLKDLDGGRYLLSAQRNGYVNQTYGQKSTNDQGTTISLTPGQKLGDILFRLIQGGVIAGRVVDEDSEPMPRVQVQALQLRYFQGRRRLVPMGNGSTDDRGEYRIFGVRPGQVYVRATARGFGAFFSQGEAVDPSAPSESASYPAIFYPNVEDAGQASALTVRGGDELHADFAMNPQHSYSIAGRVMGGVQGTAGRGTFVMLSKRSDAEFSFGPGINTVVRDDNTFTFKQVLPGSYNLIAQQQDNQSTASAKVEVDVRDADVQGVVVALSPKVDVTGHVTFDGNSTAKLSAVRISLVPEDMQAMMRGAYAQAKDDGTFTFQAPADERYKLTASGAPAEMYLRSAQAGREDVLERGFSAGSSKTLELLFATGAKVTGTISTPDGAGEPGVTVVLIPERKLAGLAETSRTATTDQNGKYQILGLRPGSYRVYAFEHVEPGAYEDEEWLKTFADQAHSLRVSENGQETLDLKPIPAGAQGE